MSIGDQLYSCRRLVSLSFFLLHMAHALLLSRTVPLVVFF